MLAQTVVIAPPASSAPLTRAEWDALVAAAAERQQAIDDLARRLTYERRMAQARSSGELAPPALPVMVPPTPAGPSWTTILLVTALAGGGAWWWWRTQRRRRGRR